MANDTQTDETVHGGQGEQPAAAAGAAQSEEAAGGAAEEAAGGAAEGQSAHVVLPEGGAAGSDEAGSEAGAVGETPAEPDPSETYPMLRPLDAYPIDVPGADGRGQKLLALADPAGIAPGVVTLPPFGAAVIELCDGSRTRQEIAAEFQARYHRPLPAESLDALLKKLDDALMLDSMRFRLHCARLFAEFAEQPIRAAYAAGTRYPVEPDGVRRLIEESFAPPNGPGLPKSVPAPAPAPRVLVAPTVDFTRGGPAYAWAYRPLLDAPALPPLIVLIGCDHGAYDPIVTLTRKGFATPFGTMETDGELVDTLIADAADRSPALGELLMRDESHHRGEHSLEFLLVWLGFVLEWRRQNGLDVDQPPPKILPILCGSLHELAQNPPSRDSKLELHQTTQLLDEFAHILQHRIGERQGEGKRTLWIGGADLAHVGPRFGDPEPLSESDRDSLERRDRETLKPLLAGDAQSFLGEIRRERDRRRVVGLGSLYLLLQAARPTGGKLRCYAQCSVDSGSYISTASLIYP